MALTVEKTQKITLLDGPLADKTWKRDIFQWANMVKCPAEGGGAFWRTKILQRAQIQQYPLSIMPEICHNTLANSHPMFAFYYQFMTHFLNFPPSQPVPRSANGANIVCFILCFFLYFCCFTVTRMQEVTPLKLRPDKSKIPRLQRRQSVYPWYANCMKYI